MTREILDHPFKANPETILIVYPAIGQLLTQRAEKVRIPLTWRELKTRIQYDGYTCDLKLHWRFRKKFYIESVRIYRVRKINYGRYSVEEGGRLNRPHQSTNNLLETKWNAEKQSGRILDYHKGQQSQ